MPSLTASLFINFFGLDYFRPEKPLIGVALVAEGVDQVRSAGQWSFHAARVPILTRLWAKTPCPHQVRAPLRPVSSVRFQP